MNLTGTVSRRALSGTAASRMAVSGTIGRAQGGGGGSGTEIVDITSPDFEADVTESENVSIVSRQQAPPVTFTASGSALSDWVIYGSDKGVGDYNGPNAPTITNGYQIPVTTRLKNLLENNISNFTYRGIEFKINADKTITASGESTGTINVWFPNGSTSTPEYQQLEQKKYIISGSPSGTSNIFVAFRYKATESGSYTRVTVPSGQSVTIDNTSGNYNYVAVYIGMTSGKTIENAVLDPYLREYDDDFSYDKTFLVDKPLGAGESISKTSTEQNIQTVDGKETDFIIRTENKPDLVWLIP